VAGLNTNALIRIIIGWGAGVAILLLLLSTVLLLLLSTEQLLLEEKHIQRDGKKLAEKIARELEEA